MRVRHTMAHYAQEETGRKFAANAAHDHGYTTTTHDWRRDRGHARSAGPKLRGSNQSGTRPAKPKPAQSNKQSYAKPAGPTIRPLHTARQGPRQQDAAIVEMKVCSTLGV